MSTPKPRSLLLLQVQKSLGRESRAVGVEAEDALRSAKEEAGLSRDVTLTLGFPQVSKEQGVSPTCLHWFSFIYPNDIY